MRCFLFVFYRNSWAKPLPRRIWKMSTTSGSRRRAIRTSGAWRSCGRGKRQVSRYSWDGHRMLQFRLFARLTNVPSLRWHFHRAMVARNSVSPPFTYKLTNHIIKLKRNSSSVETVGAAPHESMAWQKAKSGTIYKQPPERKTASRITWSCC